MTLSAESFRYVADVVLTRSAIVLEDGKEYLVESRLLPVAREAGFDDVDEYVRSVRAAGRQDDLEAVVDAMTTNVTSWFRDGSPSTALTTHVVPGLVRERGALPHLRVWSAACSTGQEPFSIAMALEDALKAHGTTLEVLATDLSSRVLARARRGTYSQLEINRGLPVQLLVKHFTRAGMEWQITGAPLRQVRFERHNLLDEVPAGGPFDVVFLRNALIYFDLPVRQEILRRVRQTLSPDGYLILGSSESTVGVDDDWARVPVGRGSVYRPVARADRADRSAQVPTQATRTDTPASTLQGAAR